MQGGKVGTSATHAAWRRDLSGQSSPPPVPVVHTGMAQLAAGVGNAAFARYVNAGTGDRGSAQLATGGAGAVVARRPATGVVTAPTGPVLSRAPDPPKKATPEQIAKAVADNLDIDGILDGLRQGAEAVVPVAPPLVLVKTKAALETEAKAYLERARQSITGYVGQRASELAGGVVDLVLKDVQAALKQVGVDAVDRSPVLAALTQRIAKIAQDFLLRDRVKFDEAFKVSDKVKTNAAITVENVRSGAADLAASLTFITKQFAATLTIDKGEVTVDAKAAIGDVALLAHLRSTGGMAEVNVATPQGSMSVIVQIDLSTGQGKGVLPEKLKSLDVEAKATNAEKTVAGSISARLSGGTLDAGAKVDFGKIQAGLRGRLQGENYGVVVEAAVRDRVIEAALRAAATRTDGVSEQHFEIQIKAAITQTLSLYFGADVTARGGKVEGGAGAGVEFTLPGIGKGRAGVGFGTVPQVGGRDFPTGPSGPSLPPVKAGAGLILYFD